MTSQEIKRELESHKEHGQICRLCMSEESLEDVIKDDHLTEWIWELLAIKISGDDRMSQVICTICRIRLTEFHQFRMGCHEVQEVLQALIPDGTDDAQSANTPAQTDPTATNQLQQKGMVDNSLIRCEDCLLVFNDEKQLTNHKTIHDHENQKDIQIKSELVENVELELQGNDQNMCFEKAGSPSHIQDEEMESDLLGIEDCLVMEEVKIETPADDEAVASAESHHNKTKNEKEYRCDICQNVYSHIMQLKKHKNYHKWKLRQQTNPEEKVSKDLLAVSDSSSNLKKKDCKDRIHQCDGCPKTFQTRRILKVHKISVHGPKLHRCDICDLQFSLRTEMMRHLYTKKHMDKEEEIQKRVNEKSSNKNEQVGKAGEKHDNNKTLKPKKYLCHVCERPFETKTKVKRHIATHASPAERQQAKRVRDMANAPRPFKCETCRTAYRAKSTLWNHNKFVHGPKKFECEICGYKFPAKDKLMKHLQIHTLSGHTKEDFQALKKLSQQNDETTNQNDDDEMSDQSSVPGDNETNENDKAHKDSSKSDESSSELSAGQPFQCDVCHEAFETSVHLYCHKRFFCRQQKKMHMKNHKPKSTATKDFECTECNKICPSWKSLYFHVKNSHVRKKTLKERTVACPKCDKMFQTARQRDLHMRRVHIAAELKCEICNKKFSERVQLRQHMNNQHGEKSANSDSEDTTDGSDLEDSVQNSNEESTKLLEGNATVEDN